MPLFALAEPQPTSCLRSTTTTRMSCIESLRADRAAYHPRANDENVGINSCTPAHKVTLHGLPPVLEVRDADPDLDFSC